MARRDRRLEYVWPNNGRTPGCGSWVTARSEKNSIAGFATADLYGRVLMPGEFDSTDELLQAADLLVVPTSRPKESVAVLEAMAAGLPVLVSEGPGHQELVTDGVTGHVFPGRDPAALASAICDVPSIIRCRRTRWPTAALQRVREIAFVARHGLVPSAAVSTTGLVQCEVGTMTRRILHIIPTLDRGGAEKQLVLLATRLPRDKFDVHVCTLTRSGPLSDPLARRRRFRCTRSASAGRSTPPPTGVCDD